MPGSSPKVDPPLPLRGRWLRYFLGAVLIVAGLIAQPPYFITDPPGRNPFVWADTLQGVAAWAAIGAGAIFVYFGKTSKRR